MMNSFYASAFAACPWIVMGLVVAIACTKMRNKAEISNKNQNNKVVKK